MINFAESALRNRNIPFSIRKKATAGKRGLAPGRRPYAGLREFDARCLSPFSGSGPTRARKPPLIRCPVPVPFFRTTSPPAGERPVPVPFFRPPLPLLVRSAAGVRAVESGHRRIAHNHTRAESGPCPVRRRAVAHQGSSDECGVPRRARGSIQQDVAGARRRPFRALALRYEFGEFHPDD
jgi:hypothetical protein